MRKFLLFNSPILRNFSSLVEKKCRIINVNTHSIHENLAFEDFLFYHDNLKYPTLMLWRNDRNIVIGKYQNPWKECYMEKMEKEKVALARRKSGGGAVYQDLGNTCFTFLIPIYDNLPPLDSKHRNNKILLAALGNLGINAELSGRNDITYNGKKVNFLYIYTKKKKFSGSAYEIDFGGSKHIKKALHHGTILRDVNVTSLWNYLNPDKAKLKSKGVDSVISRVMNQKDIVPDITHEIICNEIQSEFKKSYSDYEFTEETVSNPVNFHPKVLEIYKELSSENWCSKKTPDFSNQIETRFTWGNIDLYMKVENGI